MMSKSQDCTEESTFMQEEEEPTEKSPFNPFSFPTPTSNNNDQALLTGRTLIEGKFCPKSLESISRLEEEAAAIAARRATCHVNEKGHKKKCCYRCRKKLLIVVAVIFTILIAGSLAWIITELVKLKQPKSVMLYRPTVEYLENDDRPVTIKWFLVEEHSQKPFKQANATHIQVRKSGFYHISCSLLMEARDQPTNVITLLIFYSNTEKSIYSKKTLPGEFGRFSLQQSVVLHLQQEAFFYVQVIPSTYLLKDPGGSYLSIAQLE